MKVSIDGTAANLFREISDGRKREKGRKGIIRILIIGTQRGKKKRNDNDAPFTVKDAAKHAGDTPLARRTSTWQQD